MTPDAFRIAALALDGVIEGTHMQHPDFRVGGRVFASLGYPDPHSAMVKLPPEEQARLVEAWPAVCKPAAGAWGRSGSTVLLLRDASVAMVQRALASAWAAATAKLPARPRKARSR